jgi:choline dehydrogenase-like flavoprotein
MTSATAQYTDFSRDILGRYVCNGFDEAIASTTGSPDAKLFDIIVIGGGSFGCAVAQHVLQRDAFHNHRVLVLEAGPLALPEHVQNLPMLGLGPPAPTNVDPGVPRAEVWGLPWRSNVAGGFPGLAYCVGGRSLFWGGWSPQLLDAEMPPDRWPQAVRDDLNKRYFQQSAEQIGVTETNDFIFGAMHEKLRQVLFDGIQAGNVSAAIPLNQLPEHLDKAGFSQQQRRLRKLEAPLAVVGSSPRAGFFPINKYSGMPLLMEGARQAQAESGGVDAKKRVMVVPNCHTIKLETSVVDGVGQVTAVRTNFGNIPVPERGVVIVAAGTIESTRLALLSFDGTLGYELIGTNLMAHMRSNYTIRFQRDVLNLSPSGSLEASALFVKGRKQHADGSLSHFHLQITTSGLKGLGTDSEAELFKKIPDIDTLDNFRTANDDHVVMTIRGVGELQPNNASNRVQLAFDQTDEFGMPRAFVEMADPRQPAQPGESPQTAHARELWDVMDAASDQVRQVFVGAAPFEELQRVRDGLGTTHHESGMLWMGTDPAESVTTANGRFHHVVNAYALGPCLLPTMGSPNPMLSGVALARRMADHLVAAKAPPIVEPGFTSLFDGTLASFQQWLQAGPGSFEFLADEAVMLAHPGADIGLLFFPQQFGNFVLRLQFRLDGRGDNSGVFVRFRDPRLPAPDLTDPQVVANPAWGPVYTGFEVQIDEQARPDRLDLHRTGAIYAVPTGSASGQQQFHRGSALQPGEWNDYEIAVTADTYVVRLNGFETSRFTNTDALRGRTPAQHPHSGFIGLQQHTGRVSFRAIRIKS